MLGLTEQRLQKTYTPNDANLPTITVSADFTSRGAGKFTTYLLGHAHRDYNGFLTSWTNQNIIAFPSMSNDRYQNDGSDLPRVIGTKTEDAITVVSVDVANNKVKMTRVGSNITFDFIERKKYNAIIVKEKYL